VKNSVSYPEKAFILAAGFGTRMMPLTSTCPKPLIPLWNVPIMQRTIILLRSWGVKEIVINCHHRRADIAAFCEQLSFRDITFHLSHEETILGTGGALRHARHYFDSNELFWLINADIAATLDPTPLLTSFQCRQPLASLWVHTEKGPRTVEVANNCVKTFRSANPATGKTVTFCGLHLLTMDLLNYLPEKGFCSIIAGYEKAMKSGKIITASHLPDTYWADIGTPGQYLEAHREILYAYRKKDPGQSLYDSSNDARLHNLKRTKHLTASGFVAVAPSFRCGRDVLLNDSIMWDGTYVCAGKQVSSSIVAEGATVYQKSCAADSRFTTPEHVLNRRELSTARTLFGTQRFCVEHLPPRGSDRKFMRLSSARKSCILIRYDDSQRRENAKYAALCKWLSHRNIPVPKILSSSQKNRTIFMQDAGWQDLTDLVHQKRKSAILSCYQQAIDTLVLLQTRCTQDIKRSRLILEPPFSSALYRWEHDLFIREFLQPRLDLSCAQERGLRNELEQISQLLLEQPYVLVHRDLQSSNILINQQRIALIDFQGMRMGAAAYDLASLLFDPYVSLTAKIQHHLLAYYNEHIGRHPLTSHLLSAGAMQRLIQALGAFGRLSKRPATQRFYVHIPPAQKQLTRALKHFPMLTNLQRITLTLDRSKK